MMLMILLLEVRLIIKTTMTVVIAVLERYIGEDDGDTGLAKVMMTTGMEMIRLYFFTIHPGCKRCMIGRDAPEMQSHVGQPSFPH